MGLGGLGHPLFLDQTEAQWAKKIFSGTPHPLQLTRLRYTSYNTMYIALCMIPDILEKENF